MLTERQLAQGREAQSKMTVDTKQQPPTGLTPWLWWTVEKNIGFYPSCKFIDQITSNWKFKKTSDQTRTWTEETLSFVQERTKKSKRTLYNMHKVKAKLADKLEVLSLTPHKFKKHKLLCVASTSTVTEWSRFSKPEQFNRNIRVKICVSGRSTSLSCAAEIFCLSFWGLKSEWNFRESRRTFRPPFS